MRKESILAAVCALILLASLGMTRAHAEEAQDGWWTQDVWDTAALISLGAQPPAYNASAQRYEISTPEQLLYLSGLWKTEDANGDGAPDAPCDGAYVLTADLDMSALMQRIGAEITRLSGTSAEGYMPPIAALTDEAKEGGVKCAFFGTFDGQGHIVSNLNIVRLQNKYAGLFGNVGHDLGEGTVKNLALYNIRITCLASCGLLVGGLYGDVENCVAIGTIDCLQKTAGGLAGKIKKNDNGYLGTARNCFVYADITVRGEGGENGAAGGVTSAQSDGGRIYNCYVGGSITVLGEKAESVGGITGNLKAGQAIENTVMLLKKIDVADGTTVGLLCGDYSGENGSHLVNDYVWNGTLLTGSVTSDNPVTAAYSNADAAALLSKSFYADTLGWDFDAVWSWVGEDGAGYPMPRPFAENAALSGLLAGIQSDLTVVSPVLRASEPPTSVGYAGDTVTLTCTLTLPDGASDSDAALSYGPDKDGAAYTAIVPMTDNGDGTFSAVFPETMAGTWYYFFTANVGGQTLTYPNPIKECLRLELLSPDAKYTPKQVTLSPGADPSSVGVAWITDAGAGTLTAKLLYRVAGGSDWSSVDVTEIYSADIAGNRGSVISYSADLSGLAPDTSYEYRAVTMDGANEYATETKSFTTLPGGEDFSFIVVSDLQSTTAEGYDPFLYTMESFVADTLGGTDFVVNLGDLTEDGSSLPQWRYMFSTLGDYYAGNLTAFVPGNHESSGDPGYTLFEAETNLPGGADDPALSETTGSFTAGGVCFVILNTEPYSCKEGADVAADKAAFYEAEKAYAKAAFENSGCRWRILVAHAGLIQDDPVATAFLESMCDELNVDLFFNGHIHNYYRAVVRNGQAVAAGDGTTFITTSPMGNKFDDFRPGTIDDLLQVQVGGSQDERQYFTQVTASGGGLVVTAYQRTTAGDNTNQELFADYTAIDSFALTQSLSEKYGSSAPAASSDEPAPAKPAFKWWIVAVVVGAIVLFYVVAVLVQKQRKEKTNPPKEQTKE